MKKFWNLMLAALVIFGAVACTENQEENIPEAKKEPVLSFVANIANDETRTYIEKNDENKWETKWDGNDTLYVEGYVFTNTPDAKEVFNCYDEGVKELIGQPVQISNNNYGVDSTTEMAGAYLHGYQDQFDPTTTITLDVQSAFFHFTAAQEVTLTATECIFGDKNIAEVGYVDTITFPAGEHWVAFVPCECTFSYSIDGVKCKEITTDFVAKKIYNLGELNDRVVFLKFANNTWDQGNAWFAAHFWGNGEKDVTLTKVSDGLYGCAVPAGMTHVIFCRMNPNTKEFKWNGNDSSDNRPMWNRTYEFGVVDAPYNCHFVTKWGNGFAEGNAGICPSVWGEKTITSTSINAWGVIGSMTNNWNQDMKYPMVKGADGKLIARSLVLKKDAEFKVSNGTGGWSPTNNHKITSDGVYNVTCTTSGGSFAVTKVQ